MANMTTDGKAGRCPLLSFTKPRVAGFPSMVELFSKAPSFIEEPEGLAVVPLPAGDEVSSLSAILLDNDYYSYMKSGRKTIGGIHGTRRGASRSLQGQGISRSVKTQGRWRDG